MVTLTDIKKKAKAAGYNLDDGEFVREDFGIIDKFLESKGYFVNVRNLARDAECGAPELISALSTEDTPDIEEEDPVGPSEPQESTDSESSTEDSSEEEQLEDHSEDQSEEHTDSAE